MSEPPLRAADIIAKRLYEAGCRHAFGMPGGEVLTIVDALTKAGIEFILCKHENNAGFMAEGVYHRTGAPAVLVATVGPGAMNAVNVVANADQDRVPLILISGCVDAHEAETYTHQVLDHRAVFTPITKATFCLTAEAASVQIDKAIAIASEGRPGPVFIDVPISVADALATDTDVRRADAAPVTPSGATLEQAQAWLNTTKNPVLIVGLDAMNQHAGKALRTFVDTHQIPFITTYKAKGLIEETHPLCMGAAGLSPKADKVLLPFVQNADLIICVGYDPIEMRTGWRNAWDPKKTNVIDITAAPNHHYMHQATLNFIADTGATLEALSKGTSAKKMQSSAEIETIKAALQHAFPTDEAWGPAAIIDTCRSVLPKQALATADSGAHRILLSQMWTTYEPRGLTQSSGLCTMGCAVPLAMGAALAERERTVVSFSGDAGFLMVAGELATAAELKIAPIFVVFVDASLALIELKQRQRQLTNAAVDFAKHDFAAIGQAFGGNGHTVTSRAELETALKSAMASDRFTVIAAVIDKTAYDGRI